MNLARLEAQIFLEELIDALPDWQVHEPIDYGMNYAVRGTGRRSHVGGVSSVRQSQRPGGALSHRLLHPVTVGLWSFVAVDLHRTLVLHLEHVVGDRLADAVPGALGEVDFDPHPHSVRS